MQGKNVEELYETRVATWNAYHAKISHKLSICKFNFEVHSPVKFDNLLCDAYVPDLKTVFLYTNNNMPRLKEIEPIIV